MKRLLTLAILLVFATTTRAQLGGRWDFGSSPATVNVPPVANAGPDKVITFPVNTAGLTGSGTDADGSIALYQWRQLTGAVVSIVSPNSPNTQVGYFALASVYTFELKVTDNSGATAKDTVKVTVNDFPNTAPTANAGGDLSITLPIDDVTINGSASDAEGPIAAYSWTKISGPAGGTITSPTTATTTVQDLPEGTHQFRLTVTDNAGLTGSDVMQVVVHPFIPPPNNPPTVNGGANQVITLPVNNVSVTAVGTDTDGSITGYTWTKQTGPSGGTIATPNSATTVINGLTQGVYEFKVTVTDNGGATASDLVQVTVNAAANQPPVANAGSDLEIMAPTATVTLNGGGTDADGSVVSFVWTKVSGGAGGTIASPNSPTTAVNGLVPGVNHYQLTITDDDGATAVDEIIVTVNPAATSANGAFSYTLASALTTSAGVYKNDSILVRTLWSVRKETAGVHTEYWDGKDDYGNTIISPDANYRIKVLSNNVQYEWQGTIGNSSDHMTGVQKYKGYRSYNGLAFGPSFGYYCTGYSEGFTSLGKFAIGTPNTCTKIFYGQSIVGDVSFVVTDGTTVFWSVHDSYSGNNSFVFGTNTSNDVEKNFSSGVPYTVTYGKPYASVISKVDAPNSHITGLALSSTYLFVARGHVNQLQVLDKNTGALVRTLTFNEVGSICVDGSNKLWAVHGTTVEKYTINGDGTITSAGVLSGPIAPASVSYGNGMIAVCDGATSQQVKFYNPSTNALTSTKGTAGGYQADATVTNDKYMFSDVNATYFSFVAWQPDNSYWVNDLGNFRTLHYSSAGAFIDRVEFPGNTYSTWADKNNINRVFTAYLEYEANYAVQTLTGSTGWTLKRNWGANVNATIYNDGAKTIKPVTLNNGRTYSFINKGGDIEIIELVTGGQMRMTGVTKNTLNGDTWFLCEDGALQMVNYTTAVAEMKRYALTGFSSGNPTWSSTPEIIASALPDEVTGNTVNSYWTRSNIMSEFNKVVWWDPSPFATGSVISHTGYHVGIMQRGANNTYLAKTEKSTHRRYVGPYPAAGWFDVGNEVSDFAGGNVNIVGRNIVTSYHGEFWKLMQSNQYNHYWDNGLAIGQFGTNRDVVGNGTPAAAGMAGNALTPCLVKDAIGDLYLYHGDESDHTGIHRWKLIGLNTISEQSVVIPFPSAYVTPATDYVNLMAGLPFDAIVLNNTAGWTRSPATDATAPNKFAPITSRQSYEYPQHNDIQIDFSDEAQVNKNVSRDLGPNNLSAPWRVTGRLGYPGNNVNLVGQTVIFYLKVLDANNKVIANMYMIGDNTNTYVKGNTGTIVTGAGLAIPEMNYLRDFEIKAASNSAITFTLANYPPLTVPTSDPTANWATPKTFMIECVSPVYAAGNPRYGNTISVQDLKFYGASVVRSIH